MIVSEEVYRSLNIPNPLSILSKLEQKVGFDWMLINDLQYHYEKTDINIYFGNNNYNVMLQGIKEDQKITDSVSKNYLHYRFYGSEQGSATIFLVFNRGQADITIARSNPNIVWIINANHPYIPEMSFEVTNEGYKLFDVNADEYGDKNSIAIKVIDRANTNITFQLPLGIISIKCDEKNSCKRIVREFNADQFIYYLTKQTIQILDPKKETKRMSPARKKLELTRRYLRLMIQNTHFSPNYIPVKKLSLIGDEKSDQVYYSTYDEQFFHTANKPGTLFEDTNRTDVHVLFFGEKYAWFKGDLLMQVASEGLEHLYYYRNLFWLSEIKTHRACNTFICPCVIYPMCLILKIPSRGKK